MMLKLLIVLSMFLGQNAWAAGPPVAKSPTSSKVKRTKKEIKRLKKAHGKAVKAAKKEKAKGRKKIAKANKIDPDGN